MRIMFTLMVVLAVFCCSPVFAQGIMKEVLDGIDFTQLPYSEAKGVPYTVCYGVDNSSNAIPNKLYENLQCTEYTLADDDDTAPVAYAKFRIPQQKTVLIVVNFGGVTDYATDMLVLVDSEGNILDTLEGTVAQPFVYIKQYRISANGDIIITAIKPQQESSIHSINLPLL